MANAFSGGVGKGGLHKTEDIKILVLYVLKTASVPFSMQSITTSITTSELANYFEVTNAVSLLCDDGLICADENQMYSLTEKGIKTEEQLHTLLNFYVLEEAKRTTSKEVIMARRLRENKVDIIATDGGYHVHISMMECSHEIMGLDVYVGTLQDAQKVKANFLDDPAKIYGTNIQLLLGYDLTENNDKGTD